MTTELLDIEPRDLKFVFEPMKHSLCSVHLGNKSDQYVAFKVKTTTPKRYCVIPNIGIIKPMGNCDFTVAMQAQQTAPPDMQFGDKFLIQSTVVPLGTTEDDITSDMFSKDSDKYIEEKKLRVILVSPTSSPVLVTASEEMKQDPCNEIHVQKDRTSSGVENVHPPCGVAEGVKGLETALDIEEDRTSENVRCGEEFCIVSRPIKKVDGMKPAKNNVRFNLAKDSEELKSRLSKMYLKLKEAEVTIMNLNEEKRMKSIENDLLKQELEVLKRKTNVKAVPVGFPLLYVCLVALISVSVGYYIHP